MRNNDLSIRNLTKMNFFEIDDIDFEKRRFQLCEKISRMKLRFIS